MGQVPHSPVQGTHLQTGMAIYFQPVLLIFIYFKGRETDGNRELSPDSLQEAGALTQVAEARFQPSPPAPSSGVHTTPQAARMGNSAGSQTLALRYGTEASRAAPNTCPDIHF